MSQLANLFDLYARLDPEPGYWIDEDDADAQTYCLKCVRAKAGDDRRYSGYGCAAEQDGCLHCDECGVLLDYVLTDHGADAELDHFKTVRFTAKKKLDRDTAYHLARLIAAKPEDPDVIQIAARAIRAMPRVPKPH